MATPDVDDLTVSVGTIRIGWCTDMGPAWLRLDGTTEYSKARYPDFWRMFARSPGVLPATVKRDTHFCVQLLDEGDALVSTGFKSPAGRMVGMKEVTLTMENIPEHDHGFVDTFAEATAQKGGLLTGVVTILSGLASKTKDATTRKAGSAKPKPFSVRPQGMTVNAFIHAGRPRY